jgi:hypothetical protein
MAVPESVPTMVICQALVTIVGAGHDVPQKQKGRANLARLSVLRNDPKMLS